MADTVSFPRWAFLTHLPAPLPGLLARCEATAVSQPAGWVAYDLRSPELDDWVRQEGLLPVLSALEHLSEIRGRINPENDPFRRAELLTVWWTAIGRAFEECHGRPLVDPAWVTSTVASLADGIRREKAFDRLPIMADALQDAGCEDETILQHFRTAGPHGHGCCLVDLVLGMP